MNVSKLSSSFSLSFSLISSSAKIKEQNKIRINTFDKILINFIVIKEIIIG